MPNSAPRTIAEVAPTLADLKKLPPAQQSLLLLARLAVIYPQVQSAGGLHKGNLSLRDDPYGLAVGFSREENSEVRRHLLGAPWTRLVTLGFIVDPAGSGFYSLTDEGYEALRDPEKDPVPQQVETPDAPQAMPTDVFVIHGRDERLRSGMFQFLQSLDLNPIEWARAVELTGKAAPYVGEVLDAAFSHAQAVVVLLSPDDLVRLRPDLCGQCESPLEMSFGHQARPNVLFEAGMAMARNPHRTVLVEIGTLRPFSDIGGRLTIRMDNSPKMRQELAQRLGRAGCPVNLTGTDWQIAGDLNAPELAAASEAISSELQARNSTPTDRDLLADLISELEDNLERARAPRIGDAYARPSSQVWKNNRNRLTLPNHLRSDVTSRYRQIDGWSTVVESGVHPNMGTPVESITADLRTQLPALIDELRKLL